MYKLSPIAIVCFLLLTWNPMIDGLACYTCSSCNDPFNQYYVQIAFINNTGILYCSKRSAAYNTSRSIESTCVEYGTVGNGQWCCQTNLCNKAKRNMLTNTFSFGIGLLMINLYFF
ncbi:unnamed protein product [Rotaria sordida]|uniref:Uncharacterized protein n=1 Tax=Rotaria sordida TaxID=392033 RepID=A0A813X789_9BILA|nr:unnamed protein product [Rotaria sordida]CAF1033060.1 unnamed protein product [Rotaria sordida]CAF3948632.1 unnamed protein product [Rotaria sordida]